MYYFYHLSSISYFVKLNFNLITLIPLSLYIYIYMNKSYDPFQIEQTKERMMNKG